VAAVAQALTGSAGAIVRSSLLTPRLRRVVVHVPDVDRLGLPLSGDAAVGVYFRAPDGAAVVGRTYTVREHDSHELAVDVVLHGDAPGTRWATTASEGDTVELAHARSWYRPPPDTDACILVADLAGLPAVARLIEEGPRVPTVAIVEMIDDRDLDYLPERDGITVVTSTGSGNGVSDSALARLVADHCPATANPYCWFGGEASEARAIRKFLRRQQHWRLEQLDVMGYWRRDADAWNRRFAPVGPRMFERYQSAIAAGRSEKAALEEYEDELERLGL
jgi:NADPH-dependent ferric siderophore reductase